MMIVTDTDISVKDDKDILLAPVEDETPFVFQMTHSMKAYVF